jgi:hypothetical protein
LRFFCLISSITKFVEKYFPIILGGFGLPIIYVHLIYYSYPYLLRSLRTFPQMIALKKKI